MLPVNPVAQLRKLTKIHKARLEEEEERLIYQREIDRFVHKIMETLWLRMYTAALNGKDSLLVDTLPVSALGHDVAYTLRDILESKGFGYKEKAVGGNFNVEVTWRVE